MVHHGQLGLQRLTSPPVVSEWTKLQPSFQPFVCFSGSIEPFQPCPYYKNWISHLEQITHRGLRISSCFLNLTPDVYGRVGYEMHSQKDLSLEGEQTHTHSLYICMYVYILVLLFLSMSLLLCELFSAWASHCTGFSCFRAQALRTWASVVSAPGFNCSMTHGISLDQGSSPCALHWHKDSFPVSHQESPCYIF